MTKMPTLKRLFVSAVCASTVAGCQSAAPVYELAEKTSANAGVFQKHLVDMAASRKALAAQRADSIVAMEAFNARLEAYIKREAYMREQSSPSAEWPATAALIKKLTALRDDLVHIEQAARIAESDRRQEILSKRKDLESHAAAIREGTNALNALAKHESTEERARFTGAFVGDVRKDVQTALESDEKTAKDAKDLIDKIKGKLADAGKEESKQPDQ